MDIVFLTFDRLTVLDAVGPYEVLARLPGAKVRFAAKSPGLVRSDNEFLALHADEALEQVRACDVLVVPGGYGERLLERDERVLTWLREIDATTRITASVCTGACLLGAAGLLKGRRANTHWAMRDRLAEFDAIPTDERIVSDGKYRTAAGVSAGIDLALALAVELAGLEVAQAIQLGIEYDPAPPIQAGNAALAPAPIREQVLARVRARDAELAASR